MIRSVVREAEARGSTTLVPSHRGCLLTTVAVAVLFLLVVGGMAWLVIGWLR